jgi:dipeptidyl aminopeptidase/acylaminoacyl peptidase
LTGLLGAYPERKDIYYERSPINFPERLSCPVIFFQGLEDKVVPADQAETMVEAIRAKGIPVCYVAFAGEQHGLGRRKTSSRHSTPSFTSTRGFLDSSSPNQSSLSTSRT